MATLALDRASLLLDLRGQTERRRLDRLRIGAAVEGSSLPRWQEEFIDWLGGIEGFEIVKLQIPKAGKVPASPSHVSPVP
jgi:hypothetical protein